MVIITFQKQLLNNIKKKSLNSHILSEPIKNVYYFSLRVGWACMDQETCAEVRETLSEAGSLLPPVGSGEPVQVVRLGVRSFTHTEPS